MPVQWPQTLGSCCPDNRANEQQVPAQTVFTYQISSSLDLFLPSTCSYPLALLRRVATEAQRQNRSRPATDLRAPDLRNPSLYFVVHFIYYTVLYYTILYYPILSYTILYYMVYVNVYIYIYIYIYVWVCMYVCMYICIYSYLYTCKVFALHIYRGPEGTRRNSRFAEAPACPMQTFGTTPQAQNPKLADQRAFDL